MQTESKVWRSVNRLLSDLLFSQGLLEFAQTCEMDFRVANWVFTPFSILHRCSQGNFGFVNFSQGVRIGFCRVAKFSHPLRNEILDFCKVCELLYFSDFPILQQIFKAFPHLF